MNLKENRTTLCVECSSTDNHCIDSRIHDRSGGRRRRYICYTCKHRWSTIEISYDLLENLYRTQPVVDQLTHGLAALRDLLSGLPLSKLGDIETQNMIVKVNGQSKDSTHV